MDSKKERPTATQETPAFRVVPPVAERNAGHLERILGLASRLCASPYAAVIVFEDASPRVAAKAPANAAAWPSQADVAALGGAARNIVIETSAAGRRVIAPLLAADGRPVGAILLEAPGAKGGLAADARAMLADLAAIAAEELARN